MAKVLVGLVQRHLRRDDTQLKLLLLCTVIATVGFAFPRLVTRFASTKRVTEALLMGATAG